VETLDYKAPEVRRRSVWLRRYAIFVPIVAACYGVAFVCQAIVGIDNYDNDTTPVPMVFRVIEYVIGFPLLDFSYNPSFPTFLGLLFCNALIWGFAVIGSLHAISVIRGKLFGGR
jgi:hypothetical protein